MNLIDIISLAKAGYKKNDIDELLKIPVDEQEKDDSDSTDESPLSKGDKETYPEEDHEEKPDFETLYNSLKTELENVKKQLSDAQKQNIKTNNDSNIDTSDTLEDIFRQFM